MDWLDSAIDLLERTYDSATDVVGDWTQAWQNQVDKFKTKAREFLSLYVRLSERSYLADKDPATKEEYASWMQKAGYIRNTIEGIARKLDWSIDTFMGGNSAAMGGMGAPVLIPLAVIAAALAAITAALSSGYKLDRKLDAIERATDSEGNMDDKLLANLFNEQAGGLLSPTNIAFVGIGAALLYWYLKGRRQGNQP